MVLPIPTCPVCHLHTLLDLEMLLPAQARDAPGQHAAVGPDELTEQQNILAGEKTGHEGSEGGYLVGGGKGDSPRGPAGLLFSWDSLEDKIAVQRPLPPSKQKRNSHLKQLFDQTADPRSSRTPPALPSFDHQVKEQAFRKKRGPRLTAGQGVLGIGGCAVLG